MSQNGSTSGWMVKVARAAVIASALVIAPFRVAHAELAVDAGSVCHDDADCHSCGYVCTNGYCEWNPSAASREGSACAASSDCRPDCDVGLACVAATCTRAACSTNAECGCGAECRTGHCYAAATQPTFGSRCGTTDDCRPECTHASCVAGACRQSCTDNTMCACGEVCSGGGCVVSTSAAPSAGASCAVEDDCRPACTELHCRGGRCLRQCADRGDCRCAEDCVNGSCVEQTTGWTTEGLSCTVDRSCHPRCWLGEAYGCREGVCLALAADDGGVASDASASLDADMPADASGSEPTTTYHGGCTTTPGPHASWRGSALALACVAMAASRLRTRRRAVRRRNA